MRAIESALSLLAEKPPVAPDLATRPILPGIALADLEGGQE
jgi:hypothetical protein